MVHEGHPVGRGGRRRNRLLAAIVLSALGIGLATGAAPASARRGARPARLTWAAVTRFRKPPFKARRKVRVTTAGAFWRAWARIRPGEEIDVRGVAFRGEAIFAKRLSGWAVVRFGRGTTFAGTPGVNLPAVWIHDSARVRFYGGTVTNPTGGTGMTVYDSSYVSWWGFTIHRTANTGLLVQGIHRADDHLDFKGSISRWGLDSALDPHSEKGTGLHGANLGDAVFGVRDSRFALSLQDGTVGSGVEAGGATSTDGFWRNTLYLRCRNLSKRAVRLTAGNCLQVWGDNVVGNDFAYIEAKNIEGRPYDASGMYGGQSLASDEVSYGRAVHTNLNSRMGDVRWDREHGPTRLGNVSPRT